MNNKGFISFEIIMVFNVILVCFLITYNIFIFSNKDIKNNYSNTVILTNFINTKNFIDKKLIYTKNILKVKTKENEFKSYDSFKKDFVKEIYFYNNLDVVSIAIKDNKLIYKGNALYDNRYYEISEFIDDIQIKKIKRNLLQIKFYYEHKKIKKDFDMIIYLYNINV
ncbi:hypothetical protein WG909_14930 [Peptostreptococcaceae bacterium AGR-M142]